MSISDLKKKTTKIIDLKFVVSSVHAILDNLFISSFNYFIYLFIFSSKQNRKFIYIKG